MAYEMIELQEIESYVNGSASKESAGGTTWFEINLPNGGASNPAPTTTVTTQEEEKAKMRRTLYIMGGIFAALIVLVIVLAKTKK